MGTIKRLIESREIIIVEEGIPFAPLRGLKGLCVDNVIYLSPAIDTRAERDCVLAEEIGHYITTDGDILDQRSVANSKQERTARAWGYERLVSLDRLVTALDRNPADKHELAELLGVTVPYLEAAVAHHYSRHGLYKACDRYVIYFNPLRVLKNIEEEETDV